MNDLVDRSVAAGSTSREDGAIKRELDSEILWAVAVAYAGGVIDRDDPACTHPVSDKGFRDIVVGFNRAMAGIHGRFPGIRCVEPPKLSRQNPYSAPGNPRDARYLPEQRALCFREFADFSEWQHSGTGDRAGHLAPPNGFAGVVAKQLGHHLISAAVVHPMAWAPGLRLMLNDDLGVTAASGWTYAEPPFEQLFPPWVAELAWKALTGTHLEHALGEFAAGAIAWRLHPEYGRTHMAPPMPDCMVHWLQDSFPFLKNEQTPATAPERSSKQQQAGVAPSSAGHRGPTRSPAAGRDPLARQHPGQTLIRLAQFTPTQRYALEAEIQWALINGYAKGIYDRDHPECTHPASDAGFGQIVGAFNAAMSDFHARFPGLRNIEPPSLFRDDPSRSIDPRMSACHLPHLRALCFREVPDLQGSYRGRIHDGTNELAPQQGFGGLVAHEYGHHLSSDAVVPPEIWTPKLEEVLRITGIAAPASGPRTMRLSDDTAFAVRVGKRARGLGLGTYAGTTPREFAAEAIAWRLHPQYAATTNAPRMPRFLESWVHDCFPFLDNGQIPEPSIEFDPDALTTRIWRDGHCDVISRAELREVMETAEVDSEADSEADSESYTDVYTSASGRSSPETPD